MLLHARDELGGTAGMAQVDLDVRLNRHQPLLDLGPMAYSVLRVVLERLRAEGRLLDDHAPPLQTAAGGLVQVGDRRAAPVCQAARSRVVGIRCVYTDLDGTLLGKGASLFRTAEGDFTLLAARALEACHRAGVEVVIKSGRRRAQVMEDARLLGQSSYIFEVGAAMVIDGETTFLTGDFAPRDGESVHDQIAATGAPDLLLQRYEGRLEYHAPFHLGPRGVARVPGARRRARGQRAARRARATRTCGSWTTARSGRTRTRSTSCRRACRRRAPWPRTCARAATAARSASRSATRARTWTWRRRWAGCSSWPTRWPAT